MKKIYRSVIILMIFVFQTIGVSHASLDGKTLAAPMAARPPCIITGTPEDGYNVQDNPDSGINFMGKWVFVDMSFMIAQGLELQISADTLVNLMRNRLMDKKGLFEAYCSGLTPGNLVEVRTEGRIIAYKIRMRKPDSKAAVDLTYNLLEGDTWLTTAKGTKCFIKAEPAEGVDPKLADHAEKTYAKVKTIVSAAMRKGSFTPLYVCTSNINRSALMHMITEDYLIRNGLKDRVHVVSSPVEDWWSSDYSFLQSANKTVKSIALDRYILSEVVEAFKSNTYGISKSLIDRADIIIVAAEEHKDRILEKFPEAAGKLFLFYELLPVEDEKYGKDVVDNFQQFDNIAGTLRGRFLPLMEMASEEDSVQDAEDEKLTVAPEDSAGIFDDVVKLSANASNRDELIIALGTSWIKGYGEPGSVQHGALNPLLQAIRRYCEKEGGVKFIYKPDDELPQAVSEARKKTGSGKARIVVLAGKSSVEADGFSGLRDDRDVFMAGVDNTDLFETGYCYVLEMLTLSLKLALGLDIEINIPGVAMSVSQNIPGMYIFVPRAVPSDPQILKLMYDPKRFA